MSRLRRFWRIVRLLENIRSLFGFLGWKITAGTLTSIVFALWGYLTKFPPPILVLLVLAAFAATLFIINELDILAHRKKGGDKKAQISSC